MHLYIILYLIQKININSFATKVGHNDQQTGNMLDKSYFLILKGKRVVFQYVCIIASYGIFLVKSGRDRHYMYTFFYGGKSIVISLCYQKHMKINFSSHPLNYTHFNDQVCVHPCQGYMYQATSYVVLHNLHV